MSREDTDTVYSYSDTIYFSDSDNEERIKEIQDELNNLDLSGDDESNESNESTILCVDIGIHHLGLAGLLFDDEYNLIRVVGIDMINITEFIHPEGINFENCHLHHTKTFTDWMEHVFYTYSHVFDGVDSIIIERQPPQGLVAVEQLIFSKYRDKCELVSPNSMHKHFNIGHMDYDRRKIAVTNISTHYILLSDVFYTENQKVLSEYNSFERKHDIADAICLGIYWLKKKHDIYIHDKRIEKVRSTKMTFRGSDAPMKEWLEQFRYVPTHPRYVPV